MSADREEFLEILSNNLSLESKWFLWALMNQKDAVHKEELRNMANSGYREHKTRTGETNPPPLVSSRHGLDIHTARLEGAGLVSVKEIGRVRMYSLTKIGEELLKYVANRDKN
jgi:hypothetical protein